MTKKTQTEITLKHKKVKKEFVITDVYNMMVLATGKYLDYDYFLQRMGNAFQYVIFKDGNFYQHYIKVNPEEGKKDFDHQQLVEITQTIKNFMETTVDTLVATKKEQEKQAKVN